MDMKRGFRKAWLRALLPGAGLMFLGGCNALSDAQLTSILQSAVGTMLNAFVTNLVATLTQTATGGGV